ncbi:hypothetical protein ACFL35_12650 [Candidatus Riflebacteria bacterium]
MVKEKTDWVAASQKAAATDKWTETILRVLTKKAAKRWKFVSFRGKRGREWRGIVDVLAIRKDTAQPKSESLKPGDLFEFILIQMKGGSAKMPSAEEKDRLRAVAKYYKARKIVLFEWKKGEKAQFYFLGKNLQWEETTATELFGK